MDSQNQLRVGIVGCGYQGQLMAEAITKTDTLRVTACADPDADATAKVAAIAGHSNVYASIEELLNQSDVDAVIIATPHHLLCEVSLAAINAQKHVLAEKPIALNEKEAADIENAVMKAGIHYMAGYSLRFFVALKQVYDVLEVGTIGDIQTIAASIGTSPMLSDWVAKPETGGGPLLYLGSHLVDEILWFLKDNPVELYANVRYRADTRTDDTSTFQIHFAKGAVAQCLVTQASDAFFNIVNIYGNEGRISLTASGFLQYDILVSSNKVEAYSQPTTIRPRLKSNPIMMMLVPELEEFAQAIKENCQPAITAADGRQVLKILDAVVESGRTGKPVKFG